MNVWYKDKTVWIDTIKIFVVMMVLMIVIDVIERW
jgi:hypothetical protein